MSIANPLTASSVIAQAKKISIIEGTKEKVVKPDLAVFSQDVLEISALGIEKLQKESQVAASKQIEDIANDVIRVSSTIGRGQTVGNLTNSQATSLYNKIASFL
ncbi:hypothetical protein AADZ84_10025 [Colwelliaceae bacterium MEBiC 14330]